MKIAGSGVLKVHADHESFSKSKSRIQVGLHSRDGRDERLAIVYYRNAVSRQAQGCALATVGASYVTGC